VPGGVDALGESAFDRRRGSWAAVACRKHGRVAGTSFSRVQTRSTATVWRVSGTTRSFRPLPVARTCGPAAR
jgi:hypothetical protein